MDDAKIELLLRQAPAPKAPPGLLDKLHAEIRLPTRSSEPAWTTSAPWWRRWLSGWAFASVAAAGVIVIAAQFNESLQLRRENEELRAAAASLDAQRQANSMLLKVRAQQNEIESLRRNNADLSRLREEVARLRQEAEAQAALQAQEQRLAAEKPKSPPLVVAGDREIDDQIAMAATAQCVNNLKQIGLAARVWSGDHNDVMPENFLVMTEELSTPKVLLCRGDADRDPASVTGWSNFSASQISYEMVTPGRKVEGNTSVIFVRCPFHGSVLLYDGSVQRLGTNGLRKCPPGATLDFYWKGRQIF